MDLRQTKPICARVGALGIMSARSQAESEIANNPPFNYSRCFGGRRPSRSTTQRLFRPLSLFSSSLPQLFLENGGDRSSAIQRDDLAGHDAERDLTRAQIGVVDHCGLRT